MKIRNILKLSGDTDTKSEINGNGSDYAAFQAKITLRFCISAVFSIAISVPLEAEGRGLDRMGAGRIATVRA